MAQNITLQGASYSNVPSVLLPKTGGGTASFVDVTDTTAAAADVASGKYFYTSAGVRTAGTSSGGSGGLTLVASESVTTSTTSTTASTVQTWNTGHSEIWQSQKVIFVKIRDHAGKRSGYFFGSDNYFVPLQPINGSTGTSSTNRVGYCYCYDGNTPWKSSTSSYGVFADTIYSDGRLRIRQRYNSSSSLTVNGTYDIEVYLIDSGGTFS